MESNFDDTKDIITDDYILSMPCNKVTNFKEVSIVVSDLMKTAKAHSDDCYGLSANQIGYSVRAAVIRTPKGGYYAIINPVIVKHSNKKLVSEEYCLSKPNSSKTIERWEWIDVLYQNANGKLRKRRFEGWESSVVQHEIDHLNGVNV